MTESAVTGHAQRDGLFGILFLQLCENIYHFRNFILSIPLFFVILQCLLGVAVPYKTFQSNGLSCLPPLFRQLKLQKTMKPILTITGSDSTGGAGIQADLRTITSLGATAMSVVTSITLQNSLGIQEFYDIPAPVIERQIEAVVDDASPQVVKVGMVRNAASLYAIVQSLRRHRPRWILYSPVVCSAYEEQLMDDQLIRLVQEQLVPLCSLLVVRQGDAAHFRAQHVIQAAASHGRCNEICSAIAVFLNQGATLDDAIRKAQLLMPANTFSREVSGRAESLYREFLTLQEQLCSHSHDVNFYADRVGVSPRYLSQVTRRMADTTPKAIIESTLLFHIKSLLDQRPALSFQEIAEQLDFSSQSHLSNLFKRLTGMTPTQYRNRAATAKGLPTNSQPEFKTR